MRVIESAEYRIKRKIPFSEWADIVHTFLEAKGLSYKKFYYYFEDFAGPGHYSVEFEILFKGAAFKHVLGVCNYAPQNQKDLEMFIESLLQILKEFENGPMIELDEHYQHGIYYDWK